MTKTVILKILFWIINILLSVLLIQELVLHHSYWSDIVWSDHMGDVRAAYWMETDQVFWQQIFRFHGAHPIIWHRLLSTLDLSVFKGSASILFIINWLCTGGIAILLMHFAAKRFDSLPLKIMLILLGLVFAFSPVLIYILKFAVANPSLMVPFLVLITLYFLWKYNKDKIFDSRFIILALLFAIAASLCYGSGILVWGSFAFYIGICGIKRKHLYWVGIAVLLVILIVLWNIQIRPMLYVELSLFRKAELALTMFTSFITNSMQFGVLRIGLSLLIILFILSETIQIIQMKIRGQLVAPARVLILAFILFVCASMLASAIGRLTFFDNDIHKAFAYAVKRQAYYSFSVNLIIALIAYLIVSRKMHWAILSLLIPSSFLIMEQTAKDVVIPASDKNMIQIKIAAIDVKNDLQDLAPPSMAVMHDSLPIYQTVMNYLRDKKWAFMRDIDDWRNDSISSNLIDSGFEIQSEIIEEYIGKELYFVKIETELVPMLEDSKLFLIQESGQISGIGEMLAVVQDSNQLDKMLFYLSGRLDKQSLWGTIYLHYGGRLIPITNARSLMDVDREMEFKFEEISNLKDIGVEGVTHIKGIEDLVWEADSTFTFNVMSPNSSFDFRKINNPRNHKRLRVKCDIISSEKTNMRLYYKGEDERQFSKENSVFQKLVKGKNSLYIDLKHGLSIKDLRLKAGRKYGKYELTEFTIYATKN